LPANAFFSGQSDLVLLWVDPERLTAELRYEAPERGAPRFPHLYGPLNVAAVLGISELPAWGPGEFVLPPTPASPGGADREL
jgi:uncharacterized protein (DUF952 family)